MQTRILDLDGSLVQQERLLQRTRPTTVPLQEWGPGLRMACGFGRFRGFEEHLATLLASEYDRVPVLNFLGSGDFHHLSLALLRRLPQPCNLLVLDNHPDWMRGVPLLHCGTWLYHAARLPSVRRVFHVGGDVDFDNAYRWLAPWSMLERGKIIVSPARRQFAGRHWTRVSHHPVRRDPGVAAERVAIENWIEPYRGDLAAHPLYLSLDKDVLRPAEAIVNWDSGHLTAGEVFDVLRVFLDAARGKLVGMDVVGDWSPVQVRGLLRHASHWVEHPRLSVNPEEARRRNESLNLRLVEELIACRGASEGQQPRLAVTGG